MDTDDFEIYPIEHKGRVYNIISPFDMSFREVRAMLDWLGERRAFDATPGDDPLGPGKLFSCDVEGVVFDVDVQGFEVIVYRRSSPL